MCSTFNFFTASRNFFIHMSSMIKQRALQFLAKGVIRVFLIAKLGQKTELAFPIELRVSFGDQRDGRPLFCIPPNYEFIWEQLQSITLIQGLTPTQKEENHGLISVYGARLHFYKLLQIFCIIIPLLQFLGSHLNHKRSGMFLTLMRRGVGSETCLFCTIPLEDSMHCFIQCPIPQAIQKYISKFWQVCSCCYLRTSQWIFAQYIQNCPNDADVEIVLQFLRYQGLRHNWNMHSIFDVAHVLKILHEKFKRKISFGNFG